MHDVTLCRSTSASCQKLRKCLYSVHPSPRTGQEVVLCKQRLNSRTAECSGLVGTCTSVSSVRAVTYGTCMSRDNGVTLV